MDRAELVQAGTQTDQSNAIALTIAVRGDNVVADVWGLTPAQCQKVKGVGDLMTRVSRRPSKHI